MTEVITIRKDLAERLMRLPVPTHESVVTLTALRRTMERQKNLVRTSAKVEPILVVGELKWGSGEGDSYYVQCRNDLPEHVISTEKLVMPVAQHYRIMDAITEKHKESYQAERSNLSRQRCIHFIANCLIDQHPYEMTGTDFDYETALHDKIKALLTERDNLKSALMEIAAIPDNLEGGDWDEIENAREIANAVLFGKKDTDPTCITITVELAERLLELDPGCNMDSVTVYDNCTDELRAAITELKGN